MQLSKFNRRQLGFGIAGGVILLLLLIYGIGVLYYQGHYLPSTTVAGQSISNQSIESAKTKIQSELENKTILFSEKEQPIGTVALKDLGVTSHFDEQLTQLMAEQNATDWPLALLKLKRSELQVTPETVRFDEAIIKDLIYSLGVNNEERTPAEDAYILDDDNVFSIIPEVYGNQINNESMTQTLFSALNHNQLEVDLKDAYIQPQIKKEDPTLNDNLKKIALMESSQITLTFDGNEVTIPKENISSWIYIDEEGAPQVDRALVEDYVRELNYQYAGLFQPRQFMSTYQGEVTIQPGTYGWYIDRHTEPDNIIADIHEGATITREPVIGGDGYGMGDSVGNSYVEVDILNQTMFIYLDGVLVLQTPVVTGKTGTNTIPGAYRVWNMESPSVLRGYNPHTDVDYEQPVQYWIAFDDQAQGIHDASWQETFGGQAYLNSGSLGCVNTPPSVMGQVFELVYYGMPVIIFY